MDSTNKSARTSGDGMEFKEEIKGTGEKFKNSEKHRIIEPTVYNNKQKSEKKSSLPIPGQYSIYRPIDDLSFRSMPPTIPKGKLYLMKPKLIKPSTEKPSDQKKIRPAKFVPFEPYPAAVNFIIKPKKQNRIKKNRNNLDINILVSQMSTMKSNELENNNDKIKIKENIATETSKQIEKLTEERDYYQVQLKFQAQVNAELKNLLVAAVGEDLQTRVNVLTEDKLQLARALLVSANNLSTHTEQIEFLAGQCEVWRSKFLASSVMIEELARWKADLTQKNSLLTNSNRNMLELTAKIREMQTELLKNLTFLANLKKLNLRSGDIYSLTAECLNITEQMVLHSGFGMPNNLNFNNLNILTDTERMTIKALEIVSNNLLETEDAFKAIVGQAKRKPSVITNQKEP